MATTSGGAGRLSSQNSRDFLRIKEEDHNRILINRSTGADRNSISGLTLSAILGDKVRPPAEESQPRAQSNRTLLDIIQDDEDTLGEDSAASWRQLTERLRHSCSSAGGSGWTSTAPNLTFNNNDASNRVMMMPSRLTRFSSDSTEPNISASGRSTERAIGRFENTSSPIPSRRSQRESDNINQNSNEGEGRGAYPAEVEQQQCTGRVSLITLLAEADAHLGLTDGSIYMLAEEDRSIDLEEVTGGGGDYNCCVCMVRRKGAAFIPCGHTFCRLCSRQLLVERQNCPLCNAPINEILDIF